MSDEQRTEAWHAARIGKVTASRFKDVLATIKSGESASRRNYRAQLVVERLTGQREESYTNSAMQWGTDKEPFAMEEYEAHSGLLVDCVGFIDHESLMAGCSPDALIDADGGLEIKAPYESAIHIETIKCGMPKHHLPQIQGCMWITGRQWWDFVSFDPRMPEGLRLYVERIPRDNAYIQKLQTEIITFLGSIDKEVETLLQMVKKQLRPN